MKINLAVTFILFFTNSSAETQEAKRFLPGLISTPKNELNFQLADDEVNGVFTRAEADYSEGKIYLTSTASGEELTTKLINFSDTRYKDSDPWLAPDGNSLYFISDRPAYDGEVKQHHNDYDIWRSKKSGQHWLAPEHIAMINSSSGEFGPELNNGYLYFSSKREGVYNIYRSKMEGERFVEPEKLGKPFNSTFHDSDFTLSRDGSIAVWWSTRPGGYGSGDLYVSRNDDGQWTEPNNLGAVVNSENLDFTPEFSPNHAKLYFATNKPFPDQDAGASDVYEIPVADIPALKAVILANAKVKLLNAFGGEKILKEIDNLSYESKVYSDGVTLSAHKKVNINFEKETIKEFNLINNETSFASRDDGYQILENKEHIKLSENDRLKLHEQIKFNFLYYLSADDFALDGPFDIRGHGSLNWFKLMTGDAVSGFLVGIDPINGRIVKVMTGSGQVVLEQNYEKHADGLIWPKLYSVPKDNLTARGEYSHLVSNLTEDKKVKMSSK